MKVRTFVGKCNMDGLHHMDDHINEWMTRNHIVPINITQTFGEERHHGGNCEPVVVTSIWYEPKDEF